MGTFVLNICLMIGWFFHSILYCDFQILTMTMEDVKTLPEKVENLKKSINDYKESFGQMENVLVRIKAISEENMTQRTARRSKMEELESKVNDLKKIRKKFCVLVL